MGQKTSAGAAGRHSALVEAYEPAPLSPGVQALTDISSAPLMWCRCLGVTIYALQPAIIAADAPALRPTVIAADPPAPQPAIVMPLFSRGSLAAEMKKHWPRGMPMQLAMR
jgi:hypothetical protein